MTSDGLAAAAPERDRICHALVDLVAERGFRATSERLIARRAEVDLPAFYRHFEDKQDCLERVWEEMTAEVISLVKAAYASQTSWRESLRAAAFAALRFLQADSLRTGFFLVGVLSGGEMVRARRDFMMKEFVDLLDAGRYEHDDPDSVPRATAEGVTGAIYESMIARFLEEGIEGLPELTVEMLYLAVLNYCGPAAAEEELRRGPDEIAAFRRGEL